MKYHLAVFCSFAAAACTPAMRPADDFPDAAVEWPAYVGDDPSGTYSLGIEPSLAPETTFRFLARIDFGVASGETGTMHVSFQPVSPDGTEVGDILESPDIAVDEDGSFEAPLAGTFPAEANPISGLTMTADLILVGSFRSGSSICGNVTGTVNATVPLSGFFAATHPADDSPPRSCSDL